MPRAKPSAGRVLETPRLILRSFRPSDSDAFAALNADPQVSAWLGGPISRAASDGGIARLEAHLQAHGFGFWAAELKADGRFVGLIGIGHMAPDMPPAPAVEAGWRLFPDVWGQGLATEGARAALDFGFDELGLKEILATTAEQNLRSRAVMERLDMVEQRERAFEHPHLAPGHPLRHHVLYVARRGARG